MKHIKRIEDWLSESASLDRLIELGLVKPESLTRIQFRISRATVRVIWEKIRDGKSHQPDSVIKKLTFGYWAVLEPGETVYDPTDSSPRAEGSMTIPGNLTLEDIINRARRLSEHEFIDFVKFIDEACCEWLKTAVEEKGAFDSHGVQMIVSNITGQKLTIDSPKRVNESRLDRLAQLGMVDPKRSNRIEYVSNRAVLVDVHERIEDGQVPAKEMGFPFFWVYGYDETGAPTNSQAGTDVLGRDFLTGSDLSELIGLDFEGFLNRVETLFADWLRAQPDEYFGKRFGFKHRPLFARDETAAILGFTDWTPLKESQSDSLSKLLKLGLIEPLSQPRIEYEVSRWFLDYMTNLIPTVSSDRLWKDDLRNAIIGRVKIYEPGNTEVARWVSLVGLDLFVDGPEDIERIREQELDRDGLRDLAAERILGVIKRGFSTNWRTSSSPDPDAEDPGIPTLIKRADQSEWSRFSLNESNAIWLFKRGLINEISYIAYEINEERLANLQSEFLDPRANEPAFRKHLIYNVLAESFSWWEHRLPEEVGKGDHNLKLSAVIDGDYWLDEGAIQLRMLMRDGDELDFDVPFEEFLQEIKHRIVEYLSGERAQLDPKYKPLYILDKETGIKYSVKTGEPM